MKKYYCWTHYDLDGVVSYLALKWIFPKLNIDYQTTSIKDFRKNYIKWLGSNNMNDYEKIFILDHDVSDYKDLVDHKNVFIIDHHKSHERNANYKNATAIVKEYSSAALLAYKVFCKLYGCDFTDAQKKLILLADDYDSYRLQFSDSKKLNTVFFETNKSFESFVKNFARGFNGFNVEQQNMIKLYDMQFDKVKEQLEIYTGVTKIQGKRVNIHSCFGNKFVNDIAAYLINERNADIAIVVNLDYNHVSFRKARNVNIDISKLVEKLDDDGGGHDYAAGCSITDKFLTFTKLFNRG